MVGRHFEIVWSATAERQLHTIFKYLEKDSPEAAEKVINKILSATRTIVKNPKKYNPDKYKIVNDGSFRALEVYKYRISYQIDKNAIVILRVMHTKQNPLRY